MAEAMLHLAINPDLDVSAGLAQMGRAGRAQLTNFLAPASATALAAEVEAHSPWNAVAFFDGRHHDFDAASIASSPRDQVDLLWERVHAAARDGFGYIYENHPVYDAWRTGDPGLDRPLDALVHFLNSEPFLALARKLADAPDISFADAQITRFGPGHFLTQHDDDVAGRNRRAAYVLMLTRRWRPDWGGQLLFYDGGTNPSGGYTPCFNALNIFKVPAIHAVTQVSTFAAARRLAVTGWLRAGEPQ
jgi:Rps23 Pro-64 3,4-dihydroxylase Tpa1-like proline 4-hydroxylase